MIFSFRRTSIILLLYIIILIVGSIFIPILQSFAHNSSVLTILPSNHPIIVDGQPNMEEWKDAYQAIFMSPHGNVTVYLKYEPATLALDGAFIIPDNTPSTTKDILDQIAFHFDVTHAASSKTEPNDHQVVFGRDKRAEYYLGKPANQGGYNLIKNSTDNSHTIVLNRPFSRADFNIISNDKSWGGEFKIYFSEDPRAYGFAIQQTNYYGPKQGVDRNFTNYPGNKTNTHIPSTWGDIRIFDLNQYNMNIKEFCHNSSPGLFKNYILCIDSIQPSSSIEEKIPIKLTISGSFGDLINGTGVMNQKLYADIRDLAKNQLFRCQDILTTDPNGKYSCQFNDVNLAKGTYNILIEPAPGIYSGLNGITELTVNEHIPTFDESITHLGAVIGVIAGGLSLLVYVPRLNQYFLEKKQRKNLYTQMTEINDEVYSVSLQDKQNYLRYLKEKRKKVLQLFNSKGINEEQYKMLDSKISDYENKLSNP